MALEGQDDSMAESLHIVNRCTENTNF